MSPMEPYKVAPPADPAALAIAEELRGPRLTLRRLHVGDAEELLAVILESRPRLRPWMRFHERITSLDEARDFLAHDETMWLRREGFHYGLRLPPTGALIGGLYMHTIHWDIPSFALGYWLRTGYDGQGYMSEAVGVGVGFLFDQLGARRVGIRCDTRNVRSAAVAERLGFVREAQLRNESRAYDGALADEYVYSLIDTDPRWPRAAGPAPRVDHSRPTR